MSKNEIVNENAPMLPVTLADPGDCHGHPAGAVLYFIRPTIVKQTSMQSTMNPNDYLIMYRQAYRSKAPKRGDIIIFKSNLPDEEGKDKLLIKRVIGLPEMRFRLRIRRCTSTEKEIKRELSQGRIHHRRRHLERAGRPLFRDGRQPGGQRGQPIYGCWVRG